MASMTLKPPGRRSMVQGGGKRRPVIAQVYNRKGARPKPMLGFHPGLLLLNGHGEKNKQDSPNRIVRATLKGEAMETVLCATFKTIFKSVLI